MPTLREISKANWNGGSTIEEINSGSLQRIADAAEAMAKNYNTILSDLEFYKKRCREMTQAKERQSRTISNLRGQITKLKKKMIDQSNKRMMVVDGKLVDRESCIEVDGKIVANLNSDGIIEDVR